MFFGDTPHIFYIPFTYHSIHATYTYKTHTTSHLTTTTEYTVKLATKLVSSQTADNDQLTVTLSSSPPTCGTLHAAVTRPGREVSSAILFINFIDRTLCLMQSDEMEKAGQRVLKRIHQPGVCV